MTEVGPESGVDIAGVDLDAAFGPALKPVRVDPIELEVRPSSLTQLDGESAPLLVSFMAATENGLKVTRFVYSELPILWIVDTDGSVWFSVEEIVETASKRFVAPRLRFGDVPKGHQKLGHPALIGGGPGRIAGEIFFDVGAESPCWAITNGSGRYGLLPGRQPNHLTNVSNLFGEHGIRLQESFIPPKTGGGR